MSATLAEAALAALTAGCGAFALKQQPFTPDAAPVSEVTVAGGDTTYVVRTDAYVLRARRRGLLWGREALDDAAWRYRWLFGAAPARAELSVDSADVLPNGPGAARPGAQRGPRAGAPSPLARRAADAWLRAADAPWWLAGGAAMLVADAGGRARAVLLTTGARELLPLGELLAAPRPARDSVDGADGVDRGPLVAAEGASLLLFLRERDAALVTSLAAEPARAQRLPELLATSTSLPHSLEQLDGEWRTWLHKQPAGSSRRVAVAP